MIELIQYTSAFKNDMLKRIADFFSFHASLLNGTAESTESSYIEAEETLENWLNPLHELYMIKSEQFVVGFLHIWYRGGNVAWIEDIYVDKDYRNKCVATQAIHIAEEIIKSHYDNLSMITVRKELYESNRDKTEKFMGLDFKY